ncbi:MAG TPA: glycosyltransferase family 87 protein [Acetobacteraceae bacterium]|nr:glycosyltransferase family 87 protein [Acetobacteraceae bacterium]
MRTLFAWRNSREVAKLAGAFALLQALVLMFFIAGTHGWIFSDVKPNTVDYAAFYAAGALADAGQPEAAYDYRALQAAEERATEPGIKHQYFFNPPTYLLIMAPLARLPYLASFVLFQAVTLGLWLALGTRVAGGGRAATLALLAVPSVWWVLGLGQNAFLSAGLMAAGFLLLPARPVLAGIAFGALCYKPHLGLMIPVALLAARQWRALLAAAGTVTALIGMTIACFGVATWRAFFTTAGQNVSGAIDTGKVLLAARIDPTGAAQFVGLAAAPARAIWVLALLGAVVTVAWVWRSGRSETRGAALAASVAIAAPFALFYDLVMASLAAAWIVRAGRARGFLHGEKAALGLLVLADLLAAPAVVAKMHLPIGALVAPTLLVLAARRHHRERSVEKLTRSSP